MLKGGTKMKLFYPNYKDSIMNVTNSFLHYYGVETPYNGQKELDSVLREKQPNHIVYVLLDGLGLNVLQKHLKEDDLLRKHIVKGISSVFPPTTVAATNSVLSGLPPITTGYLGWVQYFKEYDLNLAVFLNKDFYHSERPIEIDIPGKHLAYQDFLSKIKAKNPDVKVQRFFPSFVPNGSESFEEEIEKVLILNQNTDKSISYVYWVEPDLTEHKYGIYSKEVKEVVTQLNRQFTDLTNHVTKDTLIVLIADHGLTDIEEIPLFNYQELVQMLVRKPSLEPRAINFFVKEEFIPIFKEEFNKHFEGKFEIHSKEEFLASKLFGDGPKHPKIDDFVGDFIAVAIDKYMFSIHDEKHYKAHHAGLLEDEMIVPLIIK